MSRFIVLVSLNKIKEIGADQDVERVRRSHKLQCIDKACTVAVEHV